MTSTSQSGSVGSYFNNDINVDILWHSSVSGASTAWLMNGTSRVSSASLPSLAGWELEGINDFSGDGEADIVWRNYATGENRVWFMNDTSLSQSVNLASFKDPNWRIGGTGDFNADDKTDILWRNYKTGANSVWLMNGTSRMSGRSIQALSDVSWQIEGTGDFNADGKTDILWRNCKTGANSVWFMNGTSRVGSRSMQALSDVNWQIEGTGDFNNDARTDILWRNYSTGANSVWFMNGTSRISEVSLATLKDTRWKPLVQASITPLRPDLIVQNQYAPSSATVGDTITIGRYAKNNGQASARDSHIRYWLSDDATLNTDTDQYLGEDYVASLSAGSYEYGTFDFTYNSSWGTGTKYIFFQADGYSHITESNESNNTIYHTINIGSQPSITVMAPNGGNTLQMGQSYNITWNDNFSDNVRIWLYKGNEYLQTIVDSTESDGSYTWTLPTNLTPGSDYKVAVGIPGSTVTVYDFSDNNFSVVAPSQPDLVVQSQYAPSSATVGDTVSLSAYTKNNGQASAGSSYIRYWLSDDAVLNTSTDRYLGEDYVAPLSAGSSEYDAFDFTYNSSWGTGTKYIFFQTDIYNEVTESSESNNVAYRTISVTAPSVTVTAPNGGNTLQMGQSYNITWSDNFSDNVRIELYKGSSLVQTISSSINSNGSFTWTPSTALVAGNDYRIKISSASNSNVSDYSDTYFTLTAPSQPDLVIQNQSAPNTVFAGDTVTISASVVNQGTGSAAGSNLKYYLSNDTTLDANDIYLDYDSISSLATNGSGFGSHSFTYNSTWGTGTKYILFKADADSAVAESNELNNIAYQSINVTAPNITVTSPNGGSTLQGGQGYYISWNDNLDENVRIDLYKGNSFVQNITTSTASDGSYYWVIPTSLGSGSDYRIQIGSTTRLIYDYSDSYFAINQPGIIPATYQSFNSSNVFSLHSSPESNHTIYLDFNGHTTTGTFWNTNYGSSIHTPSYDIDGNISIFSATELENIWQIWRRVAEDFIPFNVNVTTALPSTDDLMKSSNSDTRWGIRVVIGGDGSWYGGGGGVAYMGSFNYDTDTPAFVFSNNFGSWSGAKNIAEAISHEVGHSLGLDHDGDIYGTEYYEGYGIDSTGWASIMGVGYYQNLSQWSKGEYAGANNQEDDLSIITTQNGFSYRLDDYGNQLSNATGLFFNGSTARTYGIIERNTDVDWFTFNSSTGNISLSINPFEIGPNLDIMARLYNSAGQLLQTFNPVEELFTTINFSSNPGQYYLSVEGTGKSGSNGYSDYGSLGQYSITGTVA